MPFGSEAMKQFLIECGFSITTSSSHYHRSNDVTKRYMQTVKQFIKKAADSESVIYQSLLVYRQTSVARLPYSVLEMLFSRLIRGLLFCAEMLKPHMLKSIICYSKGWISKKSARQKS